MADNILNHPQFDIIANEYETSLGLPKGLLRSVVYQESRGNPNAVSPVGARGVAQFMPATAKSYNVNPADPWDSLRGAAEYLGDNLKKYGKIEAALADYNGGPNAARAVLLGKAPPAKETQKYIPEILARLQAQNTAPASVNPNTDKVAAGVAKGDPAAIQVGELRKAGFSEWIDDALGQGATYDEIVGILAPEAQKRGLAARQEAEKRGTLGNLYEGAKNRVSDIGMSARQLESRITGNDAELQQEMAQQRAAESDLGRLATESTTAGWAGGVIPDVLAAVATAPIGGPVVGGLAKATGSRVLARTLGGATGGAALGASIPVTQEGQFGTNVATGGAIGAALPLAVSGAGKAASAVMNTDMRSLMSPSARAAYESEGMSPLAQEMLKRFGQEGTELTPGKIAAARDSIYTKPNELLSKVVIPADVTELQPRLVDIVSSYTKNTAKPDVAPFIREYASDILSKVRSGRATGDTLVSLRRDLSSRAFNETGSTKRALMDIISVVDDHLNKVAPEAKAALNTANDQWRHLQVAERVIQATKGQEGALTAKKLANAIMQENKEAFQAGKAPYQDLADAALKTYGDVPPSKIGSVARVIHNDAVSPWILAGAVAHPALAVGWVGRKGLSMLIDKLALSRAPNIQKFLQSTSNLSPQQLSAKIILSRDPEIRKAFNELPPTEQNILKQAAMAATIAGGTNTALQNESAP